MRLHFVVTATTLQAMTMLQGQLTRDFEHSKKSKVAAVAAAAGSASFGRSAHLVRSYVLNPYQLVRHGGRRGGGGAK
jgi:hypothetical protein